LALAMEDYTVTVVDIDTRTVVREFPGHQAPITDITFSSDSRWLVTASLDCTAKVWDLPTSQCVDYVLFDRPATSVDLSPASDMMATAHVGDLGVYLWTNKTLYDHVTLTAVKKDAKPRLLSLPSHLMVVEKETEEVKMEVEEDEEVFASPEQISEELITLANLPGSRWLNLLSLDTIKTKNKPKAAPKKPKAAPFFLPTIPGLTTQFDLSSVEAAEEQSKPSLGFTHFTQFGAALGQASTDEDFLAMVSQLLELGPSSLDLEVRSLGVENGGTLGLMEQFLRMVRVGLKENTNFEALQSYLGLFLKIHGETVAQEDKLIMVVEEIEKIQSEQWKSLQSDLDSCLCLVTFLKSSFL